VLNPRLVILGGPNGRLLPFIGARLDVELERFALRASRALVRVVPASLGIEAPLVGAAEMAFDPLLSDPAAFFGSRSGSLQLASA
jgi:predicted NBD/HSP70 family sugar kinase